MQTDIIVNRLLTKKGDLICSDKLVSFFGINENEIKRDLITNACYLTIQMGHFASETVIKDDVSISNDILTEVDEVMSFVIKHINKQIIISGQPEN